MRVVTSFLYLLMWRRCIRRNSTLFSDVRNLSRKLRLEAIPKPPLLARTLLSYGHAYTQQNTARCP
jgi:hypothetical protein